MCTDPVPVTIEEQQKRAKAFLQGTQKALPVRFFDTVTSTNTLLKQIAGPDLADGTTFIADRQTAGRGRLGRSFYSPEKTGLYMSTFKQTADAIAAVSCTTACAAAVCMALEEVSGKRFAIKWVNDIYLNEKKVCGILCEKTEGGVVCGIGINLRTPAEGFPQEIQHIAGAVDAVPDGDLLAGRILFHLHDLLEKPDDTYRYYESRMFLKGKMILRNGKSALVTGLDRDYRLCIRYESGEEEQLSTGEVTLHGALLSK